VAVDEQLDEALGILGRTLEVEYRFIFHYPRLLPLVPDEESRHALKTLGDNSVQHAEIVATVIRALGGEQVIPTIDPLPEPLDLPQLFREQLEYERLALALHRQAAEVVGPGYADQFRAIAAQEEGHIQLVEGILGRLSATPTNGATP